MVEIKVGDIVRLKDNEDDQKYAERFNLTGELEVSNINESIVFFKDKMWDSSIGRLELVKGASTNPFLTTEIKTIEVERLRHVGDIIPIGSDYFFTKTNLGICVSKYSDFLVDLHVEDKDIDLLIKYLQLYKEALQEVNQ